MKEKYLVILAVMVVATAVAVGFVFWSNRNLPAETLAKKQKAENPCLGLSADPGEISCEEAKAAAAAKYPGQVSDIEKTTLVYQYGEPPILQSEDKKVWLVNMKPSDPSLIPTPPKEPGSKEMEEIETLGIAVDRSTREILFLQQFFKK